MSWISLGDALEMALMAGMVDGDEVAGTRLDASMSKKPADAETPAVVRVQRHREEMSDVSNRERMNAALPIGRKQRIAPGSPIPVVASPKPAVRCFLVIEGGGGRPAGGGNSRAAYRAATREGSRVREFLKLVVG